MKYKTKKITVIQIEDEYLADLFGTCDNEEILLEDDMDAYIQEEIADGNIAEDDKDILELQAIIRKELETAYKVKVELLTKGETKC